MTTLSTFGNQSSENFYSKSPIVNRKKSNFTSADNLWINTIRYSDIEKNVVMLRYNLVDDKSDRGRTNTKTTVSLKQVRQEVDEQRQYQDSLWSLTKNDEITGAKQLLHSMRHNTRISNSLFQ